MNRLICYLSVSAVLLQPVTALAAPCCCVEPAHEQPACCHVERGQQQAAPLPRGCCTTHHAPQPLTLQADCCCAQPQADYVPTVWKTWEPGTKSLADVQFSADPLHDRAAAEVRDRTAVVAQFSPRGPALLAVLCLWLK